MLWAAPVALASLVAGGCASSREEPVGVQRQDLGPVGMGTGQDAGSSDPGTQQDGGPTDPGSSDPPPSGGSCNPGEYYGQPTPSSDPCSEKACTTLQQAMWEAIEATAGWPEPGPSTSANCLAEGASTDVSFGTVSVGTGPGIGLTTDTMAQFVIIVYDAPDPAACTCDMLDAAYGVGAKPFPGGDTGVSHPISGQMQSVGVMPGPSSWMPPAGAACIAGDPRNNPT